MQRTVSEVLAQEAQDIEREILTTTEELYKQHEIIRAACEAGQKIKKLQARLEKLRHHHQSVMSDYTKATAEEAFGQVIVFKVSGGK